MRVGLSVERVRACLSLVSLGCVLCVATGCPQEVQNNTIEPPDASPDVSTQDQGPDSDAPLIVGIEVDPPSLSLSPGDTATLQAYTVDAQGKREPRLALWSSQQSRVASVSVGKVTAISRGQALLTAQIDAFEASLTVTVTPKPPTQVTLVPAQRTMDVGERVGFVVSFFDEDDARVSLDDVQQVWTSDNPSAAVVSAEGEVRGVGAGEAVIRVQGAGLEATSAVTIRANTAEVSRATLLSSYEVTRGGQRTLEPKAFDANNDPMSGVAFTFEVSNPQVASVDAAGRLTGLSIGSTQVVARAGNIEARADITVTFNVTGLSLGRAHGCALASGVAQCWGDNSAGQLGQGNTSVQVGLGAPFGGGDYSVVRAGGDSSCAIDLRERLWCWGENAQGQLGDATTTSRAVPTQVVTDARFTAVDIGQEHACAVDTTGRVWCWGANTYGQLGTGSTTNSAQPLLVASTRNWDSVRVGQGHTCAIEKSTGSGYCWGLNATSQLGRSNTINSMTPSLVLGGQEFSSLSLGARFSCGLTRVGTPVCWGDNTQGQVGDATTIQRDAPIFVAAPNGVRFLRFATGAQHACVRAELGALYCWGDNTQGQLGLGTRVGTLEPTLVSTSFVTQRVAAGQRFSCAATDTGQVWCWGDGGLGQLGQGAVSSLVPVRVPGL